MGELAPVLAATLNLVGLLQPLYLSVSNQFKLDGFSVFSFSKLIYLRKRYKLSSAGNKFPSFLILLFVNAKNSLDNVNHPLSFVVVPFHSSPQVFD